MSQIVFVVHVERAHKFAGLGRVVELVRFQMRVEHSCLLALALTLTLPGDLIGLRSWQGLIVLGKF